jgi:cytochrome c peroxidase
MKAAVLAALALLAFSKAGLAAEYLWKLPAGFPRPLIPLDNPMSEEKVELGRRLFDEKRLSVTATYACSSCHKRALAFTDGRATALGATGESVRRGSMSLGNVAYGASFTWADPRVKSLEMQMRQPLFNRHPIEMGLTTDGEPALSRLKADEDYRALFRAAFPNEQQLTVEQLIKAIAAFERTLISGRSAFDRYVFDDDKEAMSDAAKRGMALFYSERIGCGGCHSGVNFSGALRYEGQERAVASFARNDLYDLDGKGAYPQSDQGLTEVTHRPADMGRFRVPTLRNVAATAPYMHDGSLPTLEAVLDHYEQAGHAVAPKDVKLRSFRLLESERLDLLAFLQALTDPEFLGEPDCRGKAKC